MPIFLAGPKPNHEREVAPRAGADCAGEGSRPNGSTPPGIVTRSGEAAGTTRWTSAAAERDIVGSTSGEYSPDPPETDAGDCAGDGKAGAANGSGPVIC